MRLTLVAEFVLLRGLQLDISYGPGAFLEAEAGPRIWCSDADCVGPWIVYVDGMKVPSTLRIVNWPLLVSSNGCFPFQRMAESC